MQGIDQYGFDPIFQEDSTEEQKLVVMLIPNILNWIYTLKTR